MVHIIHIDYEFEIGKYPVTFEEYDRYCEDIEIEKPMDVWGRGTQPVTSITWHNAIAYCVWLSEKTNQNYRLPLELEWEYACRAGTNSKWSFGNDENALVQYAWYTSNSYDKGSNHKDFGTHPVGEKEPNPWGLYDMYGNVWELCEDWFDGYKDGKVVRGGSFEVDASLISSSSRYSIPDYTTNHTRGFRIIRVLS